MATVLRCTLRARWRILHKEWLAIIEFSPATNDCVLR